MNNSMLAIESVSLSQEPKFDNKPKLREREQKLVNIIDAIQKIAQTNEWSSLKTEIFDGLIKQLEKELRDEAKKEDPNPNKLNRIAGQLKWAERYSDLTTLEDVYRAELSNVRMQLYGKNE